MAQLPEQAAGAIAFEVLAEIAVGATARVDLSRAVGPHPREGQLLAVKRLHPHIAEDPAFANQFLDEVWMTASLRHPNVVEVVGWGNDSQGAYLAVELVQGVSLLRLMKTVFETGEIFTERMLVFLGSRLCRGLAAAHALRAPNGEHLNLVHRDLTPGNVLVGFNGDVKIADFGLAKAKQRLTKTLTGMRKGEPTYMAPEQAMGDDIDGRADLFALGVMLFELFAGRRPWIGKSDLEVVQLTTREPPADLRELRPKIDKELVFVVNRCLEKDPAARFQSAAEIAARFDEWLSVHGYTEGNEEALARFVRRNAMRQMRWFERAVAGELSTRKPERDMPRVPTYTENTGRPEGESGPSPPRPTAPSRTTAPVDPRSQRAAAAVQKLKKLAPAPEPPRRPQAAAFDDDNETEITDVETRLAAQHRGGGAKIRASEDEEEAGEEIPTLVQKAGDALQALRASARKAAGETVQERLPRAYNIADEDSENRITEKRRPGARGPSAAQRDPDEAPTDRVKPAPRKPPVAAKSAIPRSPGIPAMPGMPGGPPALERRAPPPPPPEPPPAPPPAQAAQPASHRPVMRAPGTLPPPPPPPPAPPPPLPAATNGAPAPKLHESNGPGSSGGGGGAIGRQSHSDDVQVLDRSAFQNGMLSPELLMAEADRLAIEAVRHREEARAAAVRAERKAGMAKLAAEAAMIASDAVRLIHSQGMPAALKRLEEARAIEQGLQSGRFPAGDASGPQRIPPEMPRAPTFAGAAESRPPAFQPQPEPGRPQTFQGIPSQPPASISSGPQHAALTPQPPASQRSPQPSWYPPAEHTLPLPPAAGMPLASSSVALADAEEDFRSRLKPMILGLPMGLVIGLAVGGFGVVILLLLLLTR